MFAMMWFIVLENMQEDYLSMSLHSVILEMLHNEW